MCKFKFFVLFSGWTLLVTGCENAGNESFVNFTGFDRNLTGIIEAFAREYPVESWMEHGYFTMEYLEKINVHWLRFAPQGKREHYILAVLYFFIMVIGCTGNFLVIFMFLRFKTLRTPANTLVMNLAVSDMLMMSKMPIFIYNSIFMGPALGDLACRYYGFMGGLSGTCSICTLSAISLDRYYVVKFPLSRRFTRLRAKICLLLSWLYGITFSSIPLLDIGLGRYTPEGFLTSCSYDYLSEDVNAKIFILVFFVAAWAVPFGVITFAYANIIKVVIDSKNLAKKSMTNRDSTRHMKVEEKRRQELRLSLIVFLVIMLWFAAWTPYATVSLLGIAGRGDLISPLTSMIPALFAKSASCVDPFVYALTHPRFKAELRSIFRKKSKQQWRNGMRMWTTQSGNKRMTRKSSEYEESTMLDIAVSGGSRKNEASVDSAVILDVEMQKKNSKFRPSWWINPNFSNRSSSLRGLARTWTNRDSKIKRASVEIDSTVAYSV